MKKTTKQRLAGLVSTTIGALLVLQLAVFNPTGVAYAWGNLITNINTNEGRYNPGQTVTVWVDMTNNTGSGISNGTVSFYFKYLGSEVSNSQVVGFNLGSGASTTVSVNWTPPGTDYRGYSVEAWARDGGGNILDNLNTAVDVSSDWHKFPRYGYLAYYDAQSNGTSANNVWQLKNYHLNALQFYDWQYKHHLPLSGSVANPSSSWFDISGRTIYRQTVNDYINAAHGYNMLALNYNLMYGALSGYGEDGSGVNWQWGIFNSSHGQLNVGLPSGWPYSNIFFFNPTSAGWQNYIFSRERDVFSAYNFDGWHVDGIGLDGTVYDANGNVITNDFHTTFVPFLNAAKNSLSKRLVFNVVGGDGKNDVAQNANVDVSYMENWEGDGQNTYNDLKNAIDSMVASGGSNKGIVMAAYVNRGKGQNYSSSNPGYFNEPGVLLADATIFASGASHIELGDNTQMLNNEYFPNRNLVMSDNLKRRVKDYYDFLVAYENLLRDGLSNTSRSVSLGGLATSTNGSANTVWTFAKSGNGYDVLHLINLRGLPSNNWRDDNGSYPVPNSASNFSVKYYYGSGTVNKVSWASPDYNNGKSYDLSYATGSDGSGNYVTFTVPNLQYWDMVYLSKS